MVKNHLKQLLGPDPSESASPFMNTVSRAMMMVKISKLQAAQVYAASVMFGYFLRKVDKRFQLEVQMGTLPKSQEETIAALEKLFQNDGKKPIDIENNDSGSSGKGAFSNNDGSDDSEDDSALRRYIETFDESTLNATARMVSREGMVLAERQTGALFGNISDLANEMQKALEEGVEGNREPITSAEMLSERMNDVVSADKVSTITVAYSTQKRVVLEAVAFGSFLRDVEEKVGEYELLTELPRSGGGGPMRFGMIRGGDDDGDDDLGGDSDDNDGGGGNGGGGSKVPVGGGRR